MPLTPDLDRVAYKLRRLDAKGAGSSFVDAVIHSVRILSLAPPNHRKVLLVMAESRDRTSTASLSDALAALEREHVSVYALSFSPFLVNFAGEVLVSPTH